MREGWKSLTFGDVAKIFNGNSINAEEKKAKYTNVDEGLPYIGTKDVEIGQIDYENGVRIPNYEDFKVAKPNTVLVCAEGGSAGKKVAITDREVCFGNKLFALEPKKGNNGYFLYYYTLSNTFKEEFKKQLTGIIGGVSSKKFNLLSIPVPPLPEQERIVKKLDAAFEKIDQLKKNAENGLQAVKDLWQSALRDELKPKDGWVKKNITEIASLKAGKSLNKSDVIDTYQEGYYPVFGGNGHRGYVPYYNQEGDFSIIGRQGALCGNIQIARGKFYATEHAVLVTPIIDVDFNFLNLSLIQANINQYATGAAQPGISVAHVNEVLYLYVPEKEIQKEVVSKLDHISSICQSLQTNYEQELAEYETLKQSILRKAFSGQL